MPFETKDDLESFFEAGDGFATRGVITGDGNFRRVLNVIFDESSLAVPMYGDTYVESSKPSFECQTAELTGVVRGMQFRMPDLLAHEDGYGQTYVVEYSANEGPQTSRVYLKKL